MNSEGLSSGVLAQFLVRLQPPWGVTAAVKLMAGRLGFSLQGCFSVLVSCPLPREWAKKIIITWAQKSHTVTFAISYWSHSLFFLEVGLTRGWISGSEAFGGGHLGSCPPQDVWVYYAELWTVPHKYKTQKCPRFLYSFIIFLCIY